MTSEARGTTKRPTPAPIRHRWIIVLYPVAMIGLALCLSARATKWIEIGILAALAIAAAMCEFVLLPRMSLPLSKWCSQCGARSPAVTNRCNGCARQFGSAHPPLYPPDLKLLEASRRAARVTFMIMVVLAILVMGSLTYWMPSGGSGANMACYFLVTVYVYEFLKWGMLRRLVRKVAEYEGSVCTRCTYPLDEAMTRCPECGVRETAVASRKDWLETGLWLPIRTHPAGPELATFGTPERGDRA